MLRKRKQTKVNPVVMAELLDEPGVRKHVEKMTPGELDLYKKLLVSQGIYARYVKEHGHARRV